MKGSREEVASSQPQYVGSDPSTLTTQQLLRELASLRDIIDTRFLAMDKAVSLIQDQANRSPTVNEVYLQHEEKFKSIDRHFEDRKLAWDAVVAAAKESIIAQNASSALAIAKAEAIASKQIDQQSETIKAINKTLDDKITDVKDRVTLIEGRTSGEAASQRRGVDIWGMVLGGLGMLISIVTFVLFISRMNK